MNTYIPPGKIGWWGGPDTRVRCSIDDKVVLWTEKNATRVALKSEMVAYKGKCGNWHVGHSPRRRIGWTLRVSL